jgi:hypothetical protein
MTRPGGGEYRADCKYRLTVLALMFKRSAICAAFNPSFLANS